MLKRRLAKYKVFESKNIKPLLSTQAYNPQIKGQSHETKQVFQHIED